MRIFHNFLLALIFICYICYPAAIGQDSINGNVEKIVIITDVDDTLRWLNILDKIQTIIGAIQEKFLDRPIEPFEAARIIFTSLKDTYPQTEIHYVSAAPEGWLNIKRWLKRKIFPEGEVHQPSGYSSLKTKEELFDFKYKAISKIIKNIQRKNPGLKNIKFLFFGDNGQFDIEVYKAIEEEFKLKGIKIFIRTVVPDKDNPGTGAGTTADIISFSEEKEILVHFEKLLDQKTIEIVKNTPSISAYKRCLTSRLVEMVH